MLCVQGRSQQTQQALLGPITRVLGQEVWFNCIAVLTHSAVPPPEQPGASGVPLPYSQYMEHRMHVLSMNLR